MLDRRIIKFDFSKWAEHGLPKVEPLWLLKYLPNMPASHVAIYNDLRGPSNSLTVREAGANLSVAEAATIIKRGSADKMVAGSTGSRIHLLRTIHIALQEQLADRNTAAAGGDPKKACRPFDADRNGMVLGEGAGVLILETLEEAEKRNAKIFGEVVGYGSSSVATCGRCSGSENGIRQCAQSRPWRLPDSSPSEIGHIHAHGLSSTNTDREEAAAIKEVLPEVPVTAAKSYMGNLGGGSGMVEMIASIMALQNQQHIPVLNYETPDPDCPIRSRSRHKPIAGRLFHQSQYHASGPSKFGADSPSSTRRNQDSFAKFVYRFCRIWLKLAGSRASDPQCRSFF